MNKINYCPICKSTKILKKYLEVRDYFYGTSDELWSYWVCKMCNGLFLNPKPNPNDMEKYYKNYYTHEYLSDEGPSFLKRIMLKKIIEPYEKYLYEKNIGN